MKQLRFVKGLDVAYTLVETTDSGLFSASSTIVCPTVGNVAVGLNRRVFATMAEAETWFYTLALRLMREGFTRTVCP